MGYDFSAHDIFEMAEAIEKNGAVFYREAGSASIDEDNKTFLFKLADMEDEHGKIFSKMKSELTDTNEVNTIFDPQNENMLYLKALADTRVFFKKEVDVSSMKSILEAAIMAEKDSIIFYLGMKGLVSKSMGQARIDDIISEEMSHIRLLSNRLSIFES